MSKPVFVTLGSLLFLSGLNIGIVTLTHFNPLYCWGGLFIGPLWRMWAELLFVSSFVFFVISLSVVRWLLPLAILLMLFVASAPQFALILTGGGACQ